MDSQASHILLVEDNPDHVELILKAMGHTDFTDEIHVVGDGDKALDFLFQRGDYADAWRPCLILLDIKLPTVNGIEVLERIKADPNLRSIPVIMLTTSAGEQEIEKSYNFGANSYVVKPVDFDQLVNAIQSLKEFWLVINSLPKARMEMSDEKISRKD